MSRIIAFLLAFVAFFAAATESTAQSRWQQTVVTIVPVRTDEITGALLDTLIAVSSRADVKFRRSPEHTELVGLETLENELLDEGLDITSANQVFITYRYEADQRRFKQEILEFYFIYRPEDYDDTDMPVAIVDATQPMVRNMLMTNGTTLEANEAVFEPFLDQLRMHQLAESMVVQVGARVLREEEEALREKTRLLGIIQRFLY